MVVLTASDNNRTIRVRVGTVVEVDLSVQPPSGVNAATSSNDAVAHRVSASVATSKSQAAFRTLAAGQATLIAPIAPACPSGAPCAPGAFTFFLSVVAAAS